MKKLIMFFVLLMAIPLVIFAQDVPTGPPTGWGDILANPGIWFASMTGIAFLTAFLAAFLNAWLKITKGFYKQLISWAIAILILLIMCFANFGYAKDFVWWLAILHGFAAGLASNGVFDIPVLKAILDKIQDWFIPKPTPPIN